MLVRLISRNDLLQMFPYMDSHTACIGTQGMAQAWRQQQQQQQCGTCDSVW
jgi:hypothetical protein